MTFSITYWIRKGHSGRCFVWSLQTFIKGIDELLRDGTLVNNVVKVRSKRFSKYLTGTEETRSEGAGGGHHYLAKTYTRSGLLQTHHVYNALKRLRIRLDTFLGTFQLSAKSGDWIGPISNGNRSDKVSVWHDFEIHQEDWKTTGLEAIRQRK